MGKPVAELRKAFNEQGALAVSTMEELLKEAGIPYVYPAPTPSGRIELYSLFFAGFTKDHGTSPTGIPSSPIWTPSGSPE